MFKPDIKLSSFQKNIINKVLESVNSNKPINIAVNATAGSGKLSEYLQAHWQGASSGPRSIRNMRFFMRDVLQLFTFIPQVAGTTTAPPELKSIDFPRLLLAYEAVEWELRFRSCLPDGCETESREELECYLPKHLGLNMVLLFNHLFKGIAAFRRQELVSVMMPNCLETTWNRQHIKPPCYSNWKTWKELFGSTIKSCWNSVTGQIERCFDSLEEYREHVEEQASRDAIAQSH